MTETNPQTMASGQLVHNLPQLMIDNMAMSYIGKLMDQSNMSVFSIRTLAKVMLILSIDEIRKGVKSAFIAGKEYAPTALKYVKDNAFLLSVVYHKYLAKKVPIPEQTFEEPDPQGSSYEFEWKNCQVYGKLIYNQITRNPKCESNKFFGRVIDSVEHGKNIYSIDYRDVKIPIDQDKFLMIDKITFKSDMTFDITRNQITGESLCDYISDCPFAQALKSSTNILFERFTKMHGEAYKYGGSTLSQLDGTLVKINYNKPNMNTLLSKSTTTLIENTCLIIIMNHYPEFDARKVYIELQLINYHMHAQIKEFAHCAMSPSGSSWGDYIYGYIKTLNFGKLDLSTLLGGKIGIGDANKGNQLYSKYLQMKDTLVNGTGNENSKSNNESKKKMSVKITSPNNYTDEELVNTFLQYLESNSDDKLNQSGKEIHIYELKLDIKKKIEKVDNPEYITWKELKDELLDKNDGDDISVPAAGTKKSKSKKEGSPKTSINIPKPPPQFIEKIVLEKEIVKTEVNATFKSMDTLYLPNGVSTSLLRILDNFMNKKSGLFQRLGIPNKLGICIYGIPGTGKSTTIKVIGSYLGKDIYYVNMNGITKNSELKMMFDFVIRKQCEGGIIVFEDIDCMTNIVKPRQKEEANSSNLTEVLNSDELSLSYLLNLLDGTLCAKNTIFIMTTNHIDHLDPALVSPGRCDIKIELKNCDRYQIRRIWESVMEKQLDEEILNSIPEYKFTPAELIFHLIEYVYQVDMKPGEIFEALYKKIDL